MSGSWVEEMALQVCDAYRVPPGAIGVVVYVGNKPIIHGTCIPGGRKVYARTRWMRQHLRHNLRLDRRLDRDMARASWRPALIHNGGKP
jgi:hypothetical protein